MSQIKNTNNKTYWRSLSDKMDSDDIKSFLVNEFPEGTSELADTMTRKKFLSLMGASMAMAGLVGCRKPVQKIIPYVDAPEDVIPGIPNYFATTVPIGLNAFGAIVESHVGRPTHIEGNKNHPQSKGSVNSFIQASILDLYDPDRIKEPILENKNSSLDKFAETISSISESSNTAFISKTINSPATIGLIDKVKQKFPKASWTSFDLDSKENQISGIKNIINKEMMPFYQFDKAKVVLSIESDFLSGDQTSIHNQKTFSKARRVKDNSDSMNRLYCIESTLTSTGMMADHRFKINPNQVFNFLAELNNQLIKNGLFNLEKIEVTGIHFEQKYLKMIKVLARDLVKNRSKSIIAAGDPLSSEIHSLIFLLNQELGNNNKTIRYASVSESIKPELSSAIDLVNRINNKKVDNLFILDLDFVHLFSHMLKDSISNLVKNIYYLGSHRDLTSIESKWTIPISHYLESWGDARSIDGTLSIVQPLIRPLYNSISLNEFLSILIKEKKSDYTILKDSKLWKTKNKASFRKVIHDGFLKSSVLSNIVNVKKVNIKSFKNIFSEIKRNLLKGKSNDLTVRFSLSSQVYDGRFMNNFWLREVPDAVSKISWENVALISLKTAKDYNLSNSDLVKLSTKVNGKSATIKAPIWILPGLPNNSVILEMGYGRIIDREVDRTYIDEGVLGYNALSIKNLDSYYGSIELLKTDEKHPVACVQDHHGLDIESLAGDEVENRLPEIIRESTLENFKKDDDFVDYHDKKWHIPKKNEDIPSMYPSHDYSKGLQWGMSIDLNVCSGCNACAIACQSENNIPVVGKQQVMDGREMSWIRMDRYFKGDVENPEFALQPVACLHCENAPCEQVCPVAATVHDENGLNGMAYNRCIGTRYCANNCPYKVRRFNYYNYTVDTPDVVQMAANPDVTVRFRGVMEKCTYCVQRIHGAEIKAKLEDRELIDSDINVACQSACAMDAIKFGDINNPDSEVSKAKALSHDYSLLKMLNTKPRTTYLAKLRNPHPDLVEHEELKEHHQGGHH